MLKRSRVLVVVLLLFSIAAIAYADQPRMFAARTDLNQAKGQLQVALRNKAGHRAAAIRLINLAIVEINAGIRFDRRNNHVTANEILVSEAMPDQVHMENALTHLRNARSNLNAATDDKGGHKRNALRYIDDAIDEVKKGINAGE